MATVWFRSDTTEHYKPASPFHENIDANRAHMFADIKNVKHDHGMWWVTDGDQPSKDKVPEGK